MIVFRSTAWTILDTVWNRGIAMVFGIRKPWRQVEIISRAVSSVAANGLGFQQCKQYINPGNR